ncbi:hypothetical protein Y032_0052g2266 [Ancylostoma ceylanicum]|uniref:Uncharacterized protein n=1 Tax=Ancylostoma ceylanicum TaxID=53326 RepID=A0A016U7M3_9BILA|nr:hypothetical protein Y032_0052g2266 [Ancylostoma ceylanicum]
MVTRVASVADNVPAIACTATAASAAVDASPVSAAVAVAVSRTHASSNVAYSNAEPAVGDRHPEGANVVTPVRSYMTPRVEEVLRVSITNFNETVALSQHSHSRYFLRHFDAPRMELLVVLSCFLGTHVCWRD